LILHIQVGNGLASLGIAPQRRLEHFAFAGAANASEQHALAV